MTRAQYHREIREDAEAEERAARAVSPKAYALQDRLFAVGRLVDALSDNQVFALGLSLIRVIDAGRDVTEEEERAAMAQVEALERNAR